MTAPKRRVAAPRNDLLVTLIQGIREAIQQTADRQTAHEKYCIDREDRAQTVRHDFRAEVQFGQARHDTKIDKLSEKLDASDKALHVRISAHRSATQRLLLVIAGTAILILLGAFGWSFSALLDARTQPPAQTLPIPPSPGQVQ